MDDTIKRLQAYQEAGADVLYAPGLTTREEIAAVVRALDRPVNVIAGIGGFSLTFAELQELEVKRISLGSTLARAAITALVRAAEEMRDRATFAFGASARFPVWCLGRCSSQPGLRFSGSLACNS